jgi:hypothetical protein
VWTLDIHSECILHELRATVPAKYCRICILYQNHVTGSPLFVGNKNKYLYMAVQCTVCTATVAIKYKSHYIMKIPGSSPPKFLDSHKRAKFDKSLKISVSVFDKQISRVLTTLEKHLIKRLVIPIIYNVINLKKKESENFWKVVTYKASSSSL